MANYKSIKQDTVTKKTYHKHKGKRLYLWLLVAFEQSAYYTCSNYYYIYSNYYYKHSMV